MSLILAIDPGNIVTGWCVFDVGNHRLLAKGVSSNQEVLSVVLEASVAGIKHLAIEGMVSYGARVGAETFETCIWIGQFLQAWPGQEPAELVYRPDVKLMLCGTTAAKDPDVRRAVLQRFPATGGGSTPQVGTSKRPGPLYGCGTHIWSAIAVALACARGLGHVHTGAQWSQLHPDVHDSYKPIKK